MEPLKKQTKKKTEPTIHWASRVSQAKLWHNIIRKAVEARGKGNFVEYFRQIETMMPTIFKKEREAILIEVEKLRTTIPEPTDIMNQRELELDFYDGIMTIMTDELEEYLKTVHVEEDKTGAEFEDGQPETYGDE